jgi:hypothetical protein
MKALALTAAGVLIASTAAFAQQQTGPRRAYDQHSGEQRNRD